MKPWKPCHTVRLIGAAAAAALVSFVGPVGAAPPGAPQSHAGPPSAQKHGAAAPKGKNSVQQNQDTVASQGYRIDQPGTITFTVGMVIKGKVEKPQVMIFLPKEKPYYREFKVSHSFVNDLSDPLPFIPIVE